MNKAKRMVIAHRLSKLLRLINECGDKGFYHTKVNHNFHTTDIRQVEEDIGIVEDSPAHCGEIMEQANEVWKHYKKLSRKSR